ncbi:HD domain-containing phosphohydrolase [Paenibacillus sediminis]|uniref:Nucleotidyltransferase with HDIG domain n=1 Tax=Paenibacillus sediminis TaxID=664909 RepID=A0ABS4H667_9BACL|nr:HD domain-containing phosphohydrolase [Paenibacillus sediminis]MBP1938018.1 putative nucleotidyltransferase with HDIG domain [Paenibacillus sediminis]
MRYVNIENVEPGQYLGKTVYSSNGTVLLSSGVQLTVFMINQLKRIGVTMLYIKDPDFGDIEIEEVLSDATKKTVIREMSETLKAVRSGKEWSTKKISVSVDQLLEDVLSNKELLIQLTDIRTGDNAQYVHAMNVCLIASMIGTNMGLNYSQLKDLAIGALLHDIGKVNHSEEESVIAGIIAGVKTHHTWRGFEILKAKREFNLLIAHVALQHHEQIDGKGIPRGLSEDEIHLYAKIVAVANTYDNLIGSLENPVLPHEACEKIMAMSEIELDHDVLYQFTRIISLYPNGTSVRLSTKEIGVVVRQHRGLPGRPVVHIARGSGDDLEIKEVDLAKETTVFIEAVLG